MTNGVRLTVAVVFLLIALLLVVLGWVPSPASLLSEQATVASVGATRNNWYEAVLVTQSGTRLSCKSRRGALMNPCPIDLLQGRVNAQVTVSHDGKRPYGIEADGVVLLDYRAHRKGELTLFALGGLMAAMAFGALRLRR